MESRKLAAILSSLISQLLLLLLHILPRNSPLPNSSHSLLPLLLFSHQLTTTLSLSLSRKRKRKRDSQDANPLSLTLTRTPDSFRNSFMMTSSTFQWLSGLLEPLLDCRDPAELFPLNLSPALRLAIGLSRLAAGLDYPDISARFAVSVPVSKFCVKQLCRVLCTNFRFWVSFPNPSDLRSVSQSFQSLSGLPNCCGVVFCTRFQVVNAHTNSPSPVAAQIVVDSSFRILTIAAGFLGDKTDSQILKSSTLFNDIEQGTLLNAPFTQYLVADSQYPLLPWLIVPFAQPLPGTLQADFNAAHATMRLPALRTAASLRNWGVLSRPVTEELKMAVAYIGACSILHNSLLMREDFSALASGFEDSYSGPCDSLEGEAVSSKALALRDTLAKKLHNSRNS